MFLLDTIFPGLILMFFSTVLRPPILVSDILWQYDGYQASMSSHNILRRKESPGTHHWIFSPSITLFWMEEEGLRMVVADEINGYLLFEHNLQLQLVPPERVHPKLRLYAKSGLCGVCYLYLMALIGEQFDESEEICGIVASVHQRVDKLVLWTKTSSNEAVQNKDSRKFFGKWLLHMVARLSKRFSVIRLNSL